MKEVRPAEGLSVSCGPTDDPRVRDERYRVFIEAVADGYYETDLRGNFTYFNNALCRIFGYSGHEIKGRNFRDFMDRDNAASAFSRFNQIYQSGEGITDIVWEILRKDGCKRVIELSATLIVEDDGAKGGFRGIARDVTEKHLAQRRALESEELARRQFEASRRAERRYRAFLSFLPDPVFAFNLDGSVSYLNPAFEKVFGWTLAELKGKRIPFVPESHKAQTRAGVARLFEEKVLHNFETRRLTRDGRLLDIVIDGALFYDQDNQPAGQVVTLRDITQEKRLARINQTLFRITKAIPHYRDLDGLLAFITREIQDLLDIESASIILLDEDRQEFYFSAVHHDDSETGRKFREIRFPADKGVAGHVYKTGRPLIVPDTSASPYYFKQVDEKADFHSRNMLDVPIRLQDRMIGVLCAVNKKSGVFDDNDVELLGMVAGTVALPIENARINQALEDSYEEVKSLNRAKDRVIHRLAHELKTPISVLSASLELLGRKYNEIGEQGIRRIIERSRRNLQRLLEMQYEIEDILQGRDYRDHQMLSALLDACGDELETLATVEGAGEGLLDRIRGRIDALFGPRAAWPEEIRLDDFIARTVARLRPNFAHRHLELTTTFEEAGTVWIPGGVLSKIAEGLIRNAVENTPDGSRIEIAVRRGPAGPEFEVKDCGVGLSAEDQRLIFENYFTAAEALQYSTRQPYDFDAGGRGFDLLRMKIFSERYHFKLTMLSERCRHLADGSHRCPGSAEGCGFCRSAADCRESGGTTVRVVFPPAAEVML
ncbi:MAG: PAS domain S-box protein [Desulfobacterales bacterium]